MGGSSKSTIKASLCSESSFSLLNNNSQILHSIVFLLLLIALVTLGILEAVYSHGQNNKDYSISVFYNPGPVPAVVMYTNSSGHIFYTRQTVSVPFLDSLGQPLYMPLVSDILRHIAFCLN